MTGTGVVSSGLRDKWAFQDHREEEAEESRKRSLRKNMEALTVAWEKCYFASNKPEPVVEKENEDEEKDRA